VAVLPEPMHTLAQAIYGLYERREADSSARPYLGASEIGEPCARRLWYGFRWAMRERFGGRMLRLFDTGHREEARLLDELRQLGLEVHDRQPDGSQYAVSAHGGHFRGHVDAVVRGLPEAPKTWHLVDVKTVSGKKFAELTKKGFRAAYPRYWAQGQVYMGLMMELERAAFVFVVKDTDEIHVERFEFDRPEFNRIMERAGRIIFAPEPPPGISTDPAWHECKFCPAYELCHGTAAPPATCRTCAHVTPLPTGGWRCERHDRTLTVDEQRAGCPDHRYIPSLLGRFAELVDSDGDSVRYRNALTDREFTNGPAPGYLSTEIHAADDKRALGDPATDALRAEFEGHVVTMSGAAR
jgi:hypothetical protein